MKIYNKELMKEELEKEMKNEYKKQRNELDLCRLPLCGIKGKKANKKD